MIDGQNLEPTQATTRDQLVKKYFSTAHQITCQDLQVQYKPLKGGLDSVEVMCVHTRFPNEDQSESRCFVIKRVSGKQSREATVYAEILPGLDPRLAPELLWVHQASQEHFLFLKMVRPVSKWPWPILKHSGLVLRALASLHNSDAIPEFQDWNYIEELTREGTKLVQLLDQIPVDSELYFAKRTLPTVRRLVESIPAIRNELLTGGPFPATFIHGDVHPGNVMLCKSKGELQPVFLDWARSRLGSPLEDVSSWLQSLGYWEPEAKRKHDTLLGVYLAARGHPATISSEVRDAYWLAAASNLLAGAAVYHFTVANDKTASPKHRTEALRALADCLRVFRRAGSAWGVVRLKPL